MEWNPERKYDVGASFYSIEKLEMKKSPSQIKICLQLTDYDSVKGH